MFRSSSVLIHLAKGLAGFGFLVLAFQYGEELGWWSLLLGLAALVCFQGCPMCWTVGLIGTVLDPGQSSSCVDGSCAMDKTNDT